MLDAPTRPEAGRSVGLLRTLAVLRRMVRNPMDAWPPAVYTEDMVRSRMLGHLTVFVCAPDLVQQILVDDADSFIKAEPMRRALVPALGTGILTAEGRHWRFQRRLASPVFRPSAVNAFIPAMISAARGMRDAWSALPAGSTIDATHEMMRLTFDIILETMLSGRGNIDVARVERSMRAFLEATGWLAALSAIHAPTWTPFPGKWSASRGGTYLRQMVTARVAERRHTGERREDLLSLMLDAKDPDTGEALNDEEICDNLLTFIAAGHETTALALSWTFYLLSRHPEIETRVLEEIAGVTGGAPLEAARVADLHYTRQVIQESMRIYPPAPMVVRQPNRPVTIGGYPVGTDDNVFIPIYAMHHHAKLWDDPSRFDPDRFAPEAAKARHRYAYLPFSAGPRICIGMGFSLFEAAAILGTLLPAFRLSVDPAFTPTPKLRVTMRPAEGMPMRLEVRRAGVPAG